MGTDGAMPRTTLVSLREADAMLLALRRTLGASIAGKTVLWIDDKPTNNQLPHRLLRESGASVLIALSTEQATAILEHAQYTIDLVISDMSRDKNGQAGIEVLNYLRRSGAGVPAIIYSDNPHAEARRNEIRLLGGLGPLVGPHCLFECIATLLTGTKLNQGLDRTGDPPDESPAGQP